jgi:hypothetical protein
MANSKTKRKRTPKHVLGLGPRAIEVSQIEQHHVSKFTQHYASTTIK